MEDAVRKALMYDFYGPLLTARQRDIYEMYYGQDLSLGEIAEQLRISRQAVWDIVKRAAVVLEEYEQKLGLISKHLTGHKLLAEMETRVADSRRLIAARDTTALILVLEEIEQLIHQIRSEV
ncbi:MAG: YlxM family DNA-binding protein [Firmicutes bacterium]|jgi:predicted DNA-binding protein YlxM (UPF0122 family)|nr:YlxM family DNA-binding protein [Bacillota bacterium]NLL88121.1 YlxM family DNA-binding protein [Bacillota bacterium]HKM17751.1 YlxM family DNA-binding protein [Limnochordia bacterium]